MVLLIEIKILEEERIEWLEGGDNDFSLGPGYPGGHKMDGFPSPHTLHNATFLSGAHLFVESVVHAKTSDASSLFSTFQVINQEVVWEDQHQIASASCTLHF